MTVSDIISEYGAYYLNSGQNAQRLYKQLYYQNTFDQLFTIRETNNTLFQLGSAALSRLAQPFQKAWTPTGAVTFTAAPIQLKKIKGDFEDYPDELEESWLGFLASGDLDRKEWPFVRWLMEEHLIPKMSQDVILNEAYAGEFAAVTPGTAGAAGTAMNGVKKIINDHITAGDITPFAIGAWSTTATDFVTELETEFVQAIDARYQNQPMTLVMSIPLLNRFRAGQAAKYNLYYGQAELDRFFLHPNITVHGDEALGSSQKVWCTPKENQYCVWKHGKNQGMWEIESEDRKVKLWTDFFKGYGFVIPGIVYTNDLELNP
jgi:hypothetical protein